MTSIVKHILRNMMEKKFRTAIIILTILLSTTIIFISLSLNRILNDTYTTMINGAYGNANIIVTKDSNDDNPFYEGSDIAIEGVSVLERNDMVTASGKSYLDGESVKVSLTGLDYDQAKQMELIAPIKASKPFSLKQNMAVISQKTATDHQLDIDDELKVSIHDKTYHFKVGAISETSGIYYAGIDSIALVVSPDQLNKIYEVENQFTSTLITVPDDQLNTALAKLANHNDQFIIQKTSSATTNTRDEETFEITMIAAIIIIVLISAYVILSLSKVIVSERMPVVGTFRSIGTSKRMMNRMLSAEFLLYGLIGAVLGVALAYILLPYIADLFNEYKAFGVKTNIHYSFGYTVLALIFGLFFPACVGMIHIISINKKPLKDIILNTSHTVQKRSIVSVIIGAVLFTCAFILYFINSMDHLLLGVISILLLFVAIILLVPTFLNMLSKGLSSLFSNKANGEMALGIKNIANNKLVASNCNMIIIVFILLMMVGMTTKGIDDFLNHTIENDYDIQVSDLEKDPSNYDMKDVAGVSNIRTDYISIAQYDIKGDREMFSIIGVEDFDIFAKDTSGFIFLDNAKAQMKNHPNGVLIDIYYAKRYGVKNGDTIQLQPLDVGGKPLNGDDTYLNVVVVGTVDGSGNGASRSTALLNMDYFKAHFDGYYNQIGVSVAPGYDVEKVKREIAELYFDTGVTVQTFEEMIASQRATIDTLINGITIIILMGLIVGLLGITNNLIVSFLQRKKEHAVLYSVCMSKWQLVKLQFFEMITTFIAVVLIGLIGGLSMTMLMTKLLYAIGLRLQFGFNYGLFGILCAVVFVLLALSSLSTIRKLKKLNMLKELRYDS